jgi:excisionase family DNA binding protein
VITVADVSQSLPPQTLPPAEPECMRADQLAKFLGVDRKTVYAYAAANAIPHRRLGRRIVFSRSQVVAWLRGCDAVRIKKGI